MKLADVGRAIGESWWPFLLAAEVKSLTAESAEYGRRGRGENLGRRFHMKEDRTVKQRGSRQRRKGNRKAERRAVPVMVAVRIRGARKFIVFAFLVWSSLASAATYYVSSSTGSNTNNGTSATTAWQTIGHVNAQTFNPGDSILFKRGDVWNESLTPPSSGSSGSPITFDAYGTGAAPNLTGYYAVPTTAWVLVTGNAWKAPVPSTYTAVNFCLFGSIWGQKVAAVSSNLTAQWDFYLANGYVYVYSVGNPAIYYNEPIVPMALSNVPVINVNGKSWLTFQHFLVNWFDDEGVYVQGTSDHLVFANMEADSMIPQGTQPLGFYVNESAPGPGDIKIYNAEAHLNYDGFRFDGSATAITMVNDKGYANRDGALVDNTGAVTYSYCHFYASSLAVAGSTDVEWTSGTGPITGAGNIAADTPAAVQVYQRYPAYVTLTVDDAGMTPGADTYYAGTVLPVADAAGVPVGAAITVGYPLANTLVSEFQGWINAGRDVTSHSISHTYYVNPDALDIQYIGSGTAATLNISGNTLSITVTGAAGDSVSYNLAQGQPQGTMLGLAEALAATGKYTYSFLTPCQGPYGTGCSAYTAAALLAQDLANVSGQDVKSAVYHLQLNITQLTTDEINLSRQWMTTNLTGLPATKVYVYPGGYETTAMQGIAEGVPYLGARGALKEDLGVFNTYADGFNAQNITSFGVNPSWMGITPASLNQKIQALVWKEAVWGVPWGIFWHLNELTQDDPVGGTEITNLIQDFKSDGATVLTNTALVNWLLSGTQTAGTDGNDYYKFPATSMTLDFRPTKNSPVVDAGENLGTAYELDINGVNQNSYGSGWEIGAHVYVGYATYGQAAGGGEFVIGTGAGLNPGAAALPQVWVNNQEGDSLYSYELSLPGTWVTAAAPGCTFHTPYWSGSPTFAGLQSAINDIEACRTGTGNGTALDIPPGLYTTSSSVGLIIPQSNTTTATQFNILRSTMDASLPNGTTVCSHGIQDNLGTSTDIGMDNPDCAGDVMYYQLGTTQTTIPAGAFTLANGTVTNTSAYDDVQYMWTAECSGANCSAMNFCSPVGASSSSEPPQCAGTSIGPDHWLIEDMEARMSVGNTGNNGIVELNNVGTESSTAEYATHIHFRKDWIHGDWTSLANGANAVASGINFSACVYCSLVDSQISQTLRPGAEGHAILWQGITGKIDHNWVEGSSIGLFSGGFSGSPALSPAGYVNFTDMEVRRNRFTFPYAWLGQSPIASNSHGWTGANIVRKNVIEAKSGERILRSGNIFENVDSSGGQSGAEGDLNVRQGQLNYQLTINDVVDADNIYRNTCEGFEIGGSESISGDGGGVAFPFKRGLFSNNLYYNISSTNPGCSSSQGHTMGPGTGWIWQGTVTENAAGTAATFVPTCSASGGSSGFNAGNCPGQLVAATIVSGGTGCVAGSLSIPAPPQTAPTFGIAATATYACSGGALSGVTLTKYGTQYQTNPCPVSAPCTVPTGTGAYYFTLLTTPGGVQQGSEVMDFLPGDPVSVYNCPNITAFNAAVSDYSTDYWPNGIGIKAIASSNVVGSPSVAIPLTTTANATDSSGYCTIISVPGAPQNTYWVHNTILSNANFLLTSANEAGEGPNFQINTLLRNNIWVGEVGGEGWDSNRGTGCNTEQFNYDTTSLTADHDVWPGQTSSSYCAYGANPNFPVASPVLYFPATPYCPGTSATSACVGFMGGMSASTMPLALPDYHNYELIAGSSFKAGGSSQASDGTDMGANIPAIDAAQTQNLYVCATPCGSPGPYADNSLAPAGANFFGFTETDTAASNWPTVNYGMQRFWDSPPLQWPSINTAAGTFDFLNLDTMLAQAYSDGVTEAMYTLARTPTWASSNPTDTSCNYTTATSGGGDGECDAPSDLNSDGSGTNATWKAWIAAIAGHVNGATYLQTHAHIRYWEIWNEPDTEPFWAGSIAQLARLTEDANCIITGRGVIHQGGNGAATACTATAIDPTAKIVMASAHAMTPALTYGQNELYCDNTAGIPSYELPCPNPANAIAAAVDIINFHMKPGNETGNTCPAPTPCTPESAMQMYVANIQSILQPAELAKPLWDGEAAYATAGFSNAYTDPDMAASFMPRFYLINWSLGISGMAWYTWDALEAEAEEVQTAYQQAYAWLANASLYSPCAAAGTVWSCGISNSGIQYLVMWDTAQSCSSGSCTTANQTVGQQWTQYQDMTTTSAPIGVSGHSVPVGIKPVVLH